MLPKAFPTEFTPKRFSVLREGYEATKLRADVAYSQPNGCDRRAAAVDGLGNRQRSHAGQGTDYRCRVAIQVIVSGVQPQPQQMLVAAPPSPAAVTTSRPLSRGRRRG